jgi:hypothetical protein
MAALAVPDEIVEAIDSQWKSFASPGSVLTGAQRVAAAQRARGGESGGLSDAALEAVDRLAHDAHHIDRQWVEQLTDRGLSPTEYVELMGIVARLGVVDTFDRAMGDDVRALPQPVSGDPTGVTDPEAKKRSGFVPTVGPVGPPSALSLIRDEVVEQFVLHDAFYLTFEAMLDFASDRDLKRTQIELVAARTSLANDCFY